jgi:predicted RNA methylase
MRAPGVGPGGRALDVGAGTQALASVLATVLGPARVAAVDLSQSAVEACAHAVPGAEVRITGAGRLPSPTGSSPRCWPSS